MTDTHHLLISVPDEWSSDDKGTFFESIVVELLRPMRLRVERRLRVTGMEIDLLAKGEDSPRTVLVECKAHRDPVAADTITKLLGNVQLRHADEGWLFTSSDLTKDGRGLWEEIQSDHAHSRKFTWYSPSKTIEILIAQKAVVATDRLQPYLVGLDAGDWSLVLTPTTRAWLVQILEDGVPSRYCVFDAASGAPLPRPAAAIVGSVSPRYADLQLHDLSGSLAPIASFARSRAPVARVISGDAWEDPRPARPIDFVGREAVLRDVSTFIEQVREGKTSTRSFAILAPSGWGKSSLALKLAKDATGRRLERCSLTAVDARSATAPSFVVECLRMALQDAARHGLVAKGNELRVRSLREPLESPDIASALEDIRREGWTAVLLFDQFEELFAKESLFEVFNAVRDLTLDIDAAQLPLVLGFAWKTDVSLPQQHPAYHLWHQLTDRRRTFKVGEFGRGDVDRVVSKAERALGKKLSRVLRSRLAEQCQGLPWLLKKLLVHVLQRVTTPESQYLLLERELDIEQLFRDDLEQLQDAHLRCLKFVAARAPVAVAEVEENFARDTTNLLINLHLLVRSGMNYVVYWDIFRDYLIEERVPEIPWSRTFQRMPAIAFKAVRVLSQGALSAAALGRALSLKEGPTFNVLGDLVALQLVEADSQGAYRIARHIGELTPDALATAAAHQLRRHVVVKAIERTWHKGQVHDYEEWVALFASAQPRSRTYSQETVRQYAGNLKSWLVFSGLLETRAKGIARSDGSGAQMGVLASSRTGWARGGGGVFLGSSSPRRLEELLRRVWRDGAVSRDDLTKDGLRNAILDAVNLRLVVANGSEIKLARATATEDALLEAARLSVREQEAPRLAVQCLSDAADDRPRAASLLASELGAMWQPASALRNLGGLLRYAAWASGNVATATGEGLPFERSYS